MDRTTTLRIASRTNRRQASRRARRTHKRGNKVLHGNKPTNDRHTKNSNTTGVCISTIRRRTDNSRHRSTVRRQNFVYTVRTQSGVLGLNLVHRNNAYLYIFRDHKVTKGLLFDDDRV